MTEDSGIVTGDSGQSRKSVTFNQNLRSRSVGTTGHVQTESAVNIARNTQDPGVNAISWYGIIATSWLQVVGSKGS